MDIFGSPMQDLFNHDHDELLNFEDPPPPEQSEPGPLAELEEMEMLSNSAVSWDEIFRQAETHLSLSPSTAVNEVLGSSHVPGHH